jgi:uncharacterized protein
MWQGEGTVDQFTSEENWSRLRKSELGRLAVAAAGQVDIFPINYYVDRDTILFRTAEGTKLLELTINGRVAFEIDGHTDIDAWSIVVKGDANAVTSQSEILAADKLPLSPWVPTLKYTYVRITPAEITSRHFVRTPEPERY